MSRSWERAVERNKKQINKRRKKEGKSYVTSVAGLQVDRFKGRNYLFPAALLLLTAFYITIMQPWRTDLGESTTIFWITIGCYLLLALFYFMRRPYLAVSRDTLETRKFTGYKTLKPSDIRKITLTPGYVAIQTVKGQNWVFSKLLNRYPIAAMGERLTAYAALHRVELEHKAK